MCTLQLASSLLNTTNYVRLNKMALLPHLHRPRLRFPDAYGLIIIHNCSPKKSAARLTHKGDNRSLYRQITACLTLRYGFINFRWPSHSGIRVSSVIEHWTPGPGFDSHGGMIYTAFFSAVFEITLEVAKDIKHQITPHLSLFVLVLFFLRHISCRKIVHLVYTD